MLHNDPGNQGKTIRSMTRKARSLSCEQELERDAVHQRREKKDKVWRRAKIQLPCKADSGKVQITMCQTMRQNEHPSCGCSRRSRRPFESQMQAVSLSGHHVREDKQSPPMPEPTQNGMYKRPCSRQTLLVQHRRLSASGLSLAMCRSVRKAQIPPVGSW